MIFCMIAHLRLSSTLVSVLVSKNSSKNSFTMDLNCVRPCLFINWVTTRFRVRLRSGSKVVWASLITEYNKRKTYITINIGFFSYLEILGQQEQIKEGLDDHVEIRGLIGILREVPRLKREELPLQVRQRIIQAHVHEFPFGSAEVVDEADEVEHFFLEMHGEAVLEVERGSLAQVVDEDTARLVSGV